MFTALGMIALLAFGSSPFEAFCLSMTAISTGGLTLRDGSLFTYLGFGQQAVVSLLCLIGSISVPILVMVTLGRKARGNFPVTEMRAFNRHYSRLYDCQHAEFAAYASGDRSVPVHISFQHGGI